MPGLVPPNASWINRMSLKNGIMTAVPTPVSAFELLTYRLNIVFSIVFIW